MSKFIKKNFHLIITKILLISILIISYKTTILEILSAGGVADFQWQPSKCVFEGINHYSSYLSRDGKCLVFMSQLGEYAQGLYILLYPFIFFEWHYAKVLWTIINIFLIFLTHYILCKKFEVNKIYSLIIIFFILSSTITKINLIMGQHTVVTLFFLTLAFIYKNKFSYILSGISYFKYNIGYGLFIFYLVQKKYKELLLSIIPCVFGFLIYCFITQTNLITNILQPIQLMVYNAQFGTTLNRPYLFYFILNIPISLNYKYLLILFFTLIFNLVITSKIVKLTSDLQKLSCLCILILISTPHWGHDNIILTPLLIFAIRYYQSNLLIMLINIIVVIYFLNFFRTIQIYLNLDFNYNYLNILILLSILFLNLKLKVKNNVRHF
jgi:hypothetical protein